MKRLSLVNQVVSLTTFCIITTTVHAGIPAWSFIPNESPVVTVSATETKTVSYTLSNNSKKPHQLVLSSKTPTGIRQLGGPCVLAAKSPANPNPSCTLTLSINGPALAADHLSGGPVLCQANANGTPNAHQCYQPSPGDTLVITRTTVPDTTTLSTSIAPPSILALSVNDPSLNALTGNARQITISNTGINDARGLTIAYPTWPGGTTATSTCGASLAAGASCTITITPGSNATSSCNTGIAPTPGTITVTASNVATSLTSNVVVLRYGCQYQGGFLYSVDDTTANTGSIGGKVASLVDQAAPFLLGRGPQPTSVIWSSNGISGTCPSVINDCDASFDLIPGIDESSVSPSNPSPDYPAFETFFSTTYTNPNPWSTSPFNLCNGRTDGWCNTENIVTFYNQFITNFDFFGSPPYTATTGPTDSNYYAAGLCSATQINGYSDWYLPAFCEMDAVYPNISCPAGVQSMVVHLAFLIGDMSAATPSTSCTPPSGTDCLAGYYWSSTEYSIIDSQYYAWYQVFDSSTVSGRNGEHKGNQYGVRCSRALTF